MHPRPLSRALIAALLPAALLPATLTAQVGETTARRDDGGLVLHDPLLTWSEGNYQVLHNGVDGLWPGLGAGGSSVPDVDGVGTWIPGEQLRGNHLTSLGTFGYRLVGFRETVLVDAGGPLEIHLPHIAWLEYDGGNPHQPQVFTLPYDTSCGTLDSFGVESVPWGAPPGEPPFLLGTTPGGEDLIHPNEDVLSGPATVEVIAEFEPIVLPIDAPGHLWEVQIELVTPLESGESVDGWYHWARSAPGGNQHFAVSEDELNLWMSHTVVSAGGLTGVQPLPARVEYGLMLLSGDPVTAAALAPVGHLLSGPYHGEPVSGPNTGFDLGMGSLMASLSGVQGVSSGPGPLGNQDPAATGGGAVPSIGFVTFDNTDYDGDGDLVGTPPQGGQRLTWVGLDMDLLFGIDPGWGETIPVGPLGQVALPLRVPASAPAPFPQPLSLSLLALFTHQTAPVAWPDPGGLGAVPGEFGVPLVAGSSVHIPLATVGPVCAGVPVGLSYGSSGLSGGGLTWDPTVARVSGTRQLVLVD